jgi:hypothetical protein
VLVLIPQPVTDHARRCLLLDYAYGAELHYAPDVPRVVSTALRLCAGACCMARLPIDHPCRRDLGARRDRLHQRCVRAGRAGPSR